MASILKVKDKNGNIIDIPIIKGADGKTPIKGADYFTDADKIEIAEQAAALIDTSLVSAIGTGVLQ